MITTAATGSSWRIIHFAARQNLLIHALCVQYTFCKPNRSEWARPKLDIGDSLQGGNISLFSNLADRTQKIIGYTLHVVT